MLKIFIAFVVYLSSIVAIGQNNQTDFNSDLEYNIKVEVSKVISNQGKVIFALYDSEENFMQRKVLKAAHVDIINNEAHYTFSHLTPGTYAVVCLHDTNENGRMDFESNGMPKEDYGMSNNVMSFGPPNFEEAKFKLTNSDLNIEIKF